MNHVCFLQGESNLKFILYVCKKLNPFLPSLDDLKKFSLPGFVPPSKVCLFQLYNINSSFVALLCEWY